MSDRRKIQVMPIKAGTSQKTVSSNIREIHSGPQYKKTKAKHGAATANAQAVAIAMNKRRESMCDVRRLSSGTVIKRIIR